MVYTISKRKAMNHALCVRFAGHRFEEDQGNMLPRMRTNSLPGGVELIDDKNTLEVAAFRYRDAFGLPLPIFIEMGSTTKVWEVNYVDHFSEKSMEEVKGLMRRTRIYAEVL